MWPEHTLARVPVLWPYGEKWHSDVEDSYYRRGKCLICPSEMKVETAGRGSVSGMGVAREGWSWCLWVPVVHCSSSAFRPLPVPPPLMPAVCFTSLPWLTPPLICLTLSLFFSLSLYITALPNPLKRQWRGRDYSHSEPRVQNLTLVSRSSILLSADLQWAMHGDKKCHRQGHWC